MLFNGGMDPNLNNDYNQQIINQEPNVIGSIPTKQNGKPNKLVPWGLIFSFLFPFLGLIICVISLTQEELMNVGAGMSVGIVPQPEVDSDELSLEDLDNVFAGPNRVAMEEKALEHPELYRESQIDALVEAQIKAEEMAAA